jgi:hypothetical protein
MKEFLELSKDWRPVNTIGYCAEKLYKKLKWNKLFVFDVVMTVI